ncbi:hypothetical protein [Uliginosibacterium aquaticum]|uniref:Uncharacterized protein n=1 Tax=Uliginosibacterium aquaticum TaxID=2731212 RepID=A0ABX2IH69_9RHOO|nr:hypothetical protein [Uliginosibacterium aquaticum]NSL56076.1 hypothetical protein [Uliginosibacterium aquaticum]
MPLGRISEALIGGVAEFVGEIVLRWPGRKLCQHFRRDTELESPWAFWAGLGFWLATMGSAWLIHALLWR